MKSGFLGAIAIWLVGAGWAAAQAPAPGPALSPYPAASLPSYPTGPVVSPMPTMMEGPAGDPMGLPADAYGAHGGPVTYADADYLLYKVHGGSIPPTASVLPIGVITVNSTSPANLPLTTFIPVSIMTNATFGTGVDYGNQNGGRLNLGFWTDPDMTWGMEAVGSVIERGGSRFGAISSNTSNIFSINTGVVNNLFGPVTTSIFPGPPLLIVPNPPAVVGTIPVVLLRQSQSSLIGTTSNQYFGGELNARCVGLRIGCVDFGGLLGFRYAYFRDDISLFNTTQLVQPAGVVDPLGSTTPTNLSFTSLDRVTIYNHFFGGQAGFDVDAKFGSFFIYTRLQLALGNMHQVAEVTGVTTTVNNDPINTIPASSRMSGGLLSAPSDQGGHTRNRFSYVPELNLKVGYQFTSWLRGYVGFDALTLGDVARAGSSSTTTALNTNINVAGGSPSSTTLSQPTFRFTDRDVLLEGLTFGLEVRY